MPKTYAPHELIDKVMDVLRFMSGKPIAGMSRDSRLTLDLKLTQLQIEALAYPLTHIAEKYKAGVSISRAACTRCDTVQDIIDLAAKTSGFDTPTPAGA